MKTLLIPLALFGLTFSPLFAEEQGPPTPGPGHERPGPPGADKKNKRPPPIHVAIRTLEDTVKMLEGAPEKQDAAIASCKETLRHLRQIAETMPKPEVPGHGGKKKDGKKEGKKDGGKDGEREEEGGGPRNEK